MDKGIHDAYDRLKNIDEQMANLKQENEILKDKKTAVQINERESHKGITDIYGPVQVRVSKE